MPNPNSDKHRINGLQGHAKARLNNSSDAWRPAPSCCRRCLTAGRGCAACNQALWTLAGGARAERLPCAAIMPNSYCRTGAWRPIEHKALFCEPVQEWYRPADSEQPFKKLAHPSHPLQRGIYSTFGLSREPAWVIVMHSGCSYQASPAAWTWVGRYQLRRAARFPKPNGSGTAPWFGNCSVILVDLPISFLEIWIGGKIFVFQKGLHSWAGSELDASLTSEAAAGHQQVQFSQADWGYQTRCRH